MRSKKRTRIFLFLLSLFTSFVPLNGADTDSIYDSDFIYDSYSDKENNMPLPIEEEKKQLALSPLESQNESEIDRQELHEALNESYMQPLIKKAKDNFGLVLDNNRLTQIARNLQPLIDFFNTYNESSFDVQPSHDQNGKPLKALYDFEEILQKVKKCKDESDRLYTFSLILLGLPTKLVKSVNLISLTEMLEKYCGMEVYTKAIFNYYDGIEDVENVYPKQIYYDKNIDEIIDKLKCRWEAVKEKSYKIDCSIVTNMAVSPDDSFLLWMQGLYEVYLLDIKKTKPVRLIRAEERVNELIWSPDGKSFVCSSADGYGYIWFCNKNKDGKFQLNEKLEVAKTFLTAICYTKHGLFVGDGFGHLHVVKNFEKAYKVETLVNNNDHTKRAITNVVSLSNNCILFNRGKNICIYDECKKELIYTLNKDIKIHNIKACPNGKYVAFSYDTMLEIWYWNKEKKTLGKKPVQCYTNLSSSIRFLHDSRFIFAGGFDSVVIIDILGQRKIEVAKSTQLVYTTSFNQCNRFVTVNFDGLNGTSFDMMINIWKLTSKRKESPGLVPFILESEWGLPIASCENEIFALITDYAFDLPFSWIWKK
ncbi:MAG: WD40 repeat domain-containing protein [Bacteroidota bacterium]